METHSDRLGRRDTDRFSGLLVAGCLVGFVVAAPTVWSRIADSPDRTVALVAAGALTLLWFAMATRLTTAVLGQLRGRTPVTSGGFVWLASLIVSAITLVTPAGASARSNVGATTVSTPASVNYEVRPGDSLWSIAQHELGDPHQWRTIVESNQSGANGTHVITNPQLIRPGWHLRLPESWTTGTSPSPSARTSPEPLFHPPTITRAPRASTPASHRHEFARGEHQASLWPESALGALPLALIAKRRRDFLTQTRTELPESEIESTIEQLRGLDADQIDLLARALSGRDAGWHTLAPSDDGPLDETPDPRVVVVMVGADGPDVLVSFARAGHSLPVGERAAAIVERSAVTLSAHGRCLITSNAHETLRALALRASFDDMVIYLGPARDLESDVAQRVVTLGPGPHGDAESIEWSGRTIHLNERAPSPLGVTGTFKSPPARVDSSVSGVRVELLRAEPAVTGLVEDFLASLRRRCVEMTAYLAVHQREPVTGDRLRTRVLGRGEDASLRTLSNTASAVRRALGADENGSRLEPVGPAGLYQLHGVSCDLNDFHHLIAAARDPHATDVAETLRRALDLVQGEPLATALRGFEWFLAEGHLARLQRDGEWAALRLAAEARDGGDWDLAFWAIERGRLIDPYSDALEAALHRVPRLREFGGDGPGRAQHQSVSTR